MKLNNLFILSKGALFVEDTQDATRYHRPMLTTGGMFYDIKETYYTLPPKIIRTLAMIQQRSNCKLIPVGQLPIHNDYELFLLHNEGVRLEAYAVISDVEALPANVCACSAVVGTQADLLERFQQKGLHPILLDPAATAHVTNDNITTLPSWELIGKYLIAQQRSAYVHRISNETDAEVKIMLEGTGTTQISTGLGFFDHMLQQLGKHAGFDLFIHTNGDLHVDEHHTIEDTALALGEALKQAFGNKQGIERYGFCLPMDDARCLVTLDIGGRPWLVYEAAFTNLRIGDVPTEMIFHFFKSLADAAQVNLHIVAKGNNDHHVAEAMFKGVAKAMKMAVRQELFNYELPTTKGVL